MKEQVYRLNKVSDATAPVRLLTQENKKHRIRGEWLVTDTEWMKCFRIYVQYGATQRHPYIGCVAYATRPDGSFHREHKRGTIVKTAYTTNEDTLIPDQFKLKSTYLTATSEDLIDIAQAKEKLNYRQALNLRKIYGVLSYSMHSSRAGVEKLINITEDKGLDLMTWLQDESATSLYRQPLVVRLSIALKIAVQIKAFHDFGFTHADLKPENICMDNKLNIQLVDASGSLPTDEVSPEFTPCYSAPELLKLDVSATDANPKSDVYSLAKIMMLLCPEFGHTFEMKQCTARMPIEQVKAIFQFYRAQEDINLCETATPEFLGMLKANPKERVSIDEVIDHLSEEILKRKLKALIEPSFEAFSPRLMAAHEKLAGFESSEADRLRLKLLNAAQGESPQALTENLVSEFERRTEELLRVKRYTDFRIMSVSPAGSPMSFSPMEMISP